MAENEDYEASRGETETHYPYIKELEPAFWKRQEEILKKLEEIEVSKTKQIISPFWEDLPPLLTEDSLLFEEYMETIIEWEENKALAEKRMLEAKEGDVVITKASSIRTKLQKKREENIEKMEEEIGKETEEQEIVVSKGYLIWAICNPPILEKRPNGAWKTDYWIPEILSEDRTGKKVWREANQTECKNWSKIPKEFKRVRYCIGVIPFESERLAEED